MTEGFPRRAQIDKFCPAELAIYNAIQEVEKMTADTRLTDAVILLGKARDKVADFIDGVYADGSYLIFSLPDHDGKRFYGKVHGQRVACWIGGMFSMIPTKDIINVTYQANKP